MSKTVKLQFEADLRYQQEAVDAVCDLFSGTESYDTAFTVRLSEDRVLDELGHGNGLHCSPQQILASLQEIQERNSLPRDTALESMNFTVEMETGTGKTYVYLRTIYELNKRYGFKRFIIVVPSVAIKEGVTKSIELMREHFHALYGGVPVHAFTYDSKSVADVAQFARSSVLEIMVCTIQVITDIDGRDDETASTARRVMYQPNEKTGGRPPIELIRACRPVVIVDEPQKVGTKGEINGLQNLNPLCTLRYSATHRDAFHPVFCLDAVEAASRQLVKSIEVASVVQAARELRPHVRLIKVGESKGELFARVELDAGKGDSRRVFKVARGEDLSLLGAAGFYPHAITVKGIHRDSRGKGYALLSNAPDERLYEGCCQEEEDMVRLMIRTTVEEHMRRVLLLRPQGIKVLSLFFLDKVENYRRFDDKGGAQPGPYALMFEEEYARAAQRHPSLFQGNAPSPRDVHDGYFAKSKKAGKGEVFVDSNGKDEKSRAAYELIMKDKERLLSLDEPLQFIFSHSALQEGWDNPNVFQVCILRDMKQTVSRRQALGRGLRLCVNAEGARVRDERINRLTVIARDSVKEFAENLQKDYENEGCRFGVVTVEKLGAIRFENEKREQERIGQERAALMIEELTGAGLLNVEGRPTQEMKRDLKEGRLLPPASCPDKAWVAVHDYLEVLCRGVVVRDVRERREQRVRKEVEENPLFQELWRRINYRTTYQVRFDSAELVRAVREELESELRELPRFRAVIEKARLDLTAGGVTVEAGHTRTMEEDVVPLSGRLCDVLTYLEDATNLTRRTLAAILLDMPVLQCAFHDEHAFLQRVVRVIQRHLRRIQTQCLEYVPITMGERRYQAQRFSQEVAESYADRILEVAGSKCLTDCVVYDSDVERRFAEDAERSEDVKLYFKLPPWFRIPTPVGDYNPDWALVIRQEGGDYMYFVAETKSTNMLGELPAEQADKIRCGKAHFAAEVQRQAHALLPPAEYRGPVQEIWDVMK